ncbi:phosphatidylserine decarboxylase proenzyme, mitochondrial [Tetranychus urticae]|uniref:Phosphatidylserine decarboxylase proenzyme, mitochondrial n=1 Tax=Tetranychus urticae TaxID=32264 RepID=T1K3B0_TETUR|nr:phosphatidylserine decarboxylase proenzyme, mitochondrial [Tetranychus urticae]
MTSHLIKSLKWKPLSIYAGLGFIGFQGYRINKARFNQSIDFDDTSNNEFSSEPTKFEISLLKLLPLRIASRVWGFVNSINLPEALRGPILQVYVKAFNCDLSEAEIEDLKHYKNLQQFFTRPLKSHVRPIAEHSLTSPSDGTIICFGPIDDHEKVEQVKGATYSLSYFLGPTTWLPEEQNNDTEKSYRSKLLVNETANRLYQCVIYLAPGDYHRFHSPVNWQVKFRRHFSGKLFSVRPTFANWMHGLFQLNERVIYLGEWAHGFFSLSAIGATNVGSVKIYFDYDLRTNKPFCRKYLYKDKVFNEDIFPSKGEPFGEFNLGSTIVLIFEAPKDFKFNLKLGQRIKFGEPLIT